MFQLGIDTSANFIKKSILDLDSNHKLQDSKNKLPSLLYVNSPFFHSFILAKSGKSILTLQDSITTLSDFCKEISDSIFNFFQFS